LGKSGLNLSLVAAGRAALIGVNLRLSLFFVAAILHSDAWQNTG
jgi:hypothetical protein